MDNQNLTMQQAAAYCNMQYETFRYYVNKSRGPDIVPFGKRKSFAKEALDNWKPEDRRNGNGKNLPRTKRKYED